jgi:hypothetical protein
LPAVKRAGLPVLKTWIIATGNSGAGVLPVVSGIRRACEMIIDDGARPEGSRIPNPHYEETA